MFHMPMSSPMMTTKLGCSCPSSEAVCCADADAAEAIRRAEDRLRQSFLLNFMALSLSNLGSAQVRTKLRLAPAGAFPGSSQA